MTATWPWLASNSLYIQNNTRAHIWLGRYDLLYTIKKYQGIVAVCTLTYITRSNWGQLSFSLFLKHNHFFSPCARIDSFCFLGQDPTQNDTELLTQRWRIVRSAKKCRHCILGLLYSAYCTYFRVESRIWDATPAQEAKYVERWPSTTSAWAGWSRYDIPVDRYGGVHSLLICTIGILDLLPATGLASRKILIQQNIKKRTGPALWLFCDSCPPTAGGCTCACTLRQILGL